MPMPASSPSCTISLFNDQVLTTYPRYAVLRSLGPAVHLDEHGVRAAAVPGYGQAQAPLKEPEPFSPVGGVAPAEGAMLRSSPGRCSPLTASSTPGCAEYGPGGICRRGHRQSPAAERMSWAA